MTGGNRQEPSRGEEYLVEARDVTLSFGRTPALRGADLAVAAGEIVAVMGPSGSGKSTLLHCLAGILVPDSGEIRFGGRRVDRMRETERSELRRGRFGFVFQFGQLVPELSAEENVALPLLLGGTRRPAAMAQARDRGRPAVVAAAGRPLRRQDPRPRRRRRHRAALTRPARHPPAAPAR